MKLLAAHSLTSLASRRLFSLSEVLAAAGLAAVLAACGTSTGTPDAAGDAQTADASSDAAGDAAACITMPGNATRGAMVASTICSQCHSADLGGMDAMQPPGENLHNDGMGAGGWTDCQLVAAIRTGVDDEGEALCGSMPRYTTDQLSDTQLADVVAYIRTLTTPGRTPAHCE